MNLMNIAKYKCKHCFELKSIALLNAFFYSFKMKIIVKIRIQMDIYIVSNILFYIF
jgi:hypothetical protein